MAGNRPIDFKFTSDVVALLNGLDKAELSVEDLEQAFVEASNSSTDLERKINKATREAERDVDKLERAIGNLGEAAQDAGRESERGFDKVGDSADDVKGRVGDTGREIGSEMMQNIGEGIGSGNISLGDTIMGTLGGVISSLPLPLAAIAGLAGAVWGVFKAESEKQKQELAESFDLVDLITGQIDRVKAFEEGIADLGGGDLQEGLKEAHRISERLGISMEDIGLIVSGEVNPAVETHRALLNDVYLNQKDGYGEARKLLDVNEENTAALAEAVQNSADYQAGLNGALNEGVKLADAIGKVNANMDDAIDKADEDILRKADENADGLLSSVEIINAELQEAIDKANELDAIKFQQKKLDVGFTYSNEAPIRNMQGQYWNPYTGKWIGSRGETVGGSHQSSQRVD